MIPRPAGLGDGRAGRQSVSLRPAGLGDGRSVFGPWAQLDGERGQQRLRDRTDPGRIERINEIINMMNIELHRAIRKKDTSFVSRTVLESTRYAPQPLVVLRAVTINPLTTVEILKEIVDEHNRLGMELYEEFYRKRFTTV